MKRKLLHKTLRPFLLYVSVILLVSVPVYYIVVDTIWRSELDEHNKMIAKKTAHALNQLHLSDTALEESILLWNRIQPGTNIERITDGKKRKDSTYTIIAKKGYGDGTDRFRCLRKTVKIHDRHYLFTVATNIEESHETILVIAMITGFFFILIVAGLLLLTKRLSQTVWLPFHNTLEKLRRFNLNHQTALEFSGTDIAEFEELNRSLTNLIEHTVAVYKAQKEFTENASHELQTPLAIIRHKLDLLLQDKDLTASQYVLAEAMNKALARSARLSKNLLLLAKIENRQFADDESVCLDEVINQSIDMLREHFEQKQLLISTDITAGTVISGSRNLIEILINNLLVNAIKHTPAGGTVSILLNASLFEISNSGNGALDGELLFRRFSRFSEDNSGSGLGLAIIKEIVHYHQWEILYRFEAQRHIFSIAL